MSQDFSDLIARLDAMASRLRDELPMTCGMLAEASGALQSLTSTIAGLEVDAERLRRELEECRQSR